MSDDLIIVVPPGTRVRYVESQYTDGKVLIADAHALQPPDDIGPQYRINGLPAQVFGLPVYDAEKYVYEP